MDGNMLPKRLFFTRGKGTGDMELESFEAALRDAGIERFNLVEVSSIIPPNCEIVKREDGAKLLSTGQIVFLVLSREESTEPNRLIASSVGMANPKDMNQHGYLSEYKSFGENEEVAGKKAEDLATKMLASTLGVEQLNSQMVKTSNITQSAIVGKNGKWTCTVAAAVFII